MSTTKRVWFIIGLAGATVLILLALGPIPQDQGYHGFADARRMLGVDNFLDVASNLPFVLIGLYGLALLARRKIRLFDRAEGWAYGALFVGLLLTGFGSAYYHENPNDETLFWDRMPLTLVFASFFAATVTERISLKAGLALLVPALFLGVTSVLVWRGMDDLRLYAFMQFYPLAAIPAMALLFKPRYSRGKELLGAVGWYAAAKAFELADKPVFEATHLLSGHTIKHLLAGISAWWILRMISKRTVLPLRDKSGKMSLRRS